MICPTCGGTDCTVCSVPTQPPDHLSPAVWPPVLIHDAPPDYAEKLDNILAVLREINAKMPASPPVQKSDADTVPPTDECSPAVSLSADDCIGFYVGGRRLGFVCRVSGSTDWQAVAQGAAGYVCGLGNRRTRLDAVDAVDAVMAWHGITKYHIAASEIEPR